LCPFFVVVCCFLLSSSLVFLCFGCVFGLEVIPIGGAAERPGLRGGGLLQWSALTLKDHGARHIAGRTGLFRRTPIPCGHRPGPRATTKVPFFEGEPPMSWLCVGPIPLPSASGTLLVDHFPNRVHKNFGLFSFLKLFERCAASQGSNGTPRKKATDAGNRLHVASPAATAMAWIAGCRPGILPSTARAKLALQAPVLHASRGLAADEFISITPAPPCQRIG